MAGEIGRWAFKTKRERVLILPILKPISKRGAGRGNRGPLVGRIRDASYARQV